MTLQIFLHFFHHKFVTSLQSTSLPQPTAHRRCATNLTTLPLTPSHRYPSQRSIGDALFFRNPIRTERSGGRMGLQATHSLGASEMRYSPTSPTARAVTLSVNPRQRRGTSAAADASRSAAADALLLSIYSGTALRCIPTPISSPGRGPGLTENGSALRTAASLP